MAAKVGSCLAIVDIGAKAIVLDLGDGVTTLKLFGDVQEKKLPFLNVWFKFLSTVQAIKSFSTS